MSGGVDSSVAAAVLADRGFEVIGVTMRLFGAQQDALGKASKTCCGSEDVGDARETCRIIGAKHYYLNLEKEFAASVIEHFIAEYERGRTPYPCLSCNDRMKFDFLLKRARMLGAASLATGHYARIMEAEDGSRLLTEGLDASKDQTYALYNLTQPLLRRLMFPMGDFTKGQTRELAARFGLPVATKPESQDICFIPSGNYRDFVKQRMRRSRSGAIVGTDGRVVGSHDGIHNFTIGQRRGIPGAGRLNRPTYVTAIDADSGRVTVGTTDDLKTTVFHVSGINWISGTSPDSKTEVHARVRYRAPTVRATVSERPRGAAVVTLERPIRAVAPGQSAVFYADGVVLGGGTIERTQSMSEPDRGDPRMSAKVGRSDVRAGASK